jgi:hypothetical protein
LFLLILKVFLFSCLVIYTFLLADFLKSSFKKIQR